MVCWQCPLLGRQLALQIDVGRNEKKGCVAGEAMHRNEWKYMCMCARAFFDAKTRHIKDIYYDTWL